MTELTKHVHRTTAARHRGRRIVVSLAPPSYIALRLQGSLASSSFLLDIESALAVAMRQHAAEVDRRSRRLAKEKRIKLVDARRQVERAIRKETAGIARAPRKPQLGFWLKCLFCGFIFKGAKWPLANRHLISQILEKAKCPDCGTEVNYVQGDKFTSKDLITMAQQKDGLLLEARV